MKTSRFVVILSVLLLVAALLTMNMPVTAKPPLQEISHDTPYIPGELVVGFAQGGVRPKAEARAGALAGEVGAMVVKTFGENALLRFDPRANVEELAEEVAAIEGVVYAEPNYVYWLPQLERSHGAPAPSGLDAKVIQGRQIAEVKEMQGRQVAVVNDLPDGMDQMTLGPEDLNAMRSLRKVNGRTKAVPTYANDASQNWGYNKIGNGIIWINRDASPNACVLDTGVDGNHPDLKGKVVNGWDFVNNVRAAGDDHGHGTHVAGVIAARINNGMGLAGVSNGKVVAVKVLSAQGWGTSADIAQGIRYCADQKAVRVLNMSLGGLSSTAMYNALNYAINEKGKLVVAAAGNSSTSVRTNAYPAAWADDSGIGEGLISVAAARAPEMVCDEEGCFWSNAIRVNGGEHEDCAASFSNYGSWVEIVAPGEEIYSTTPVSNPFYLNYFEGISSGYDVLSGSSMAAPHVAGAAARLWSIHSRPASNNWTAQQIEQQLKDNGEALNLAVDPNVAPGDVDYGYAAAGYGDDAPFCWPKAEAPYGADQDMSNARYLDVAGAMERGALVTKVFNAISGLPLTGATVQAYQLGTWKSVDTGRVTSNTNAYVWLTNLPVYKMKPDGYPMRDDKGALMREYYLLRVSRSGYTSGFQPVAFWYFPALSGLNTFWLESMMVVPPNRDLHLVMNHYGKDPDGFSLHLWLPAGSPSAVVGRGDSGHPNDVGAGALWDFPRARWQRYSNEQTPFETITIARGGGNAPYYWGEYNIMLRNTAGATGFEDNVPVVRLWYGGRVQAIWDSWELNCSSEWWNAGVFWRTGTQMNADEYLEAGCGNGGLGSGGVWPYGLDNAIFTTQEVEP